MTISNELGIPYPNLTTQYILRPRLNELLAQATCGKLIYVIGGVGQGKTQAVRHYLEQQPDAAVHWIQLTENDNIGSYLWEKLTYIVSLDNPALAAELHELGFPVTLACFKQFVTLLRNLKKHPRNIFFVLDDFHLINSKETRTFVKRCVHMKVFGMCFIICSRKEPDLDVEPLISRGKVRVIKEEALRFTSGEVAELFRLHDIPFTEQILAQALEATKGWALALSELTVALKRYPRTPKYALDAVKQNIFQILDTEVWNTFPEHVKKILAIASLVSDLPILPLEKLSGEANFLQDRPELTSFVWFNRFSNGYTIHPLYLEFLQDKQNILPHEEQQQVYRQAAEWCVAHDLHMDAMRYYAKSRQFDRMVEMFFSCPFKLPQDSSKYFLDLLDNLHPSETEQEDFNVLFLQNYFTPLLIAGTGRYEEAQARTFEVIRKWENLDTPLAREFLHTSYSILTYLDMYTCTITHQYNGPVYLKKSLQYVERSFKPPAKTGGAFINADMRSFACTIGVGATLSEFDQFLEAARETGLLITKTAHNIFSGYADLVACECAFFKNEPDLARRYAEKAILQAHEHKQYGIAALAENYLLRIAIIEGDTGLAKEILKQLNSYLDNRDFWSRQLYYDLYAGAFYAQIGILDMVPQWVVMNAKEAASEISIPARELYVHVLYYIASKKYKQALTILFNSYPRPSYERFLFGELRFSLLAAVARIRTGDTEGALVEFVRAYELSFCGEFELFFIELGKELHPLVAMTLKQANTAIPEEWLKMIDRKASIYAKKATVVANMFREAAC
ncbi:MAG: hypothetical protein FWB75_07265, partial [Oscillospiraceae bacterium]|nr:hypothetical protein [Oscillospiraceae bacterium]